MDTRQPERIEENDRPQAPKERKAYTKPAVVYEMPLEATASVCTTSPGKTIPGTGGCTVGFS